METASQLTKAGAKPAMETAAETKEAPSKPSEKAMANLRMLAALALYISHVATARAWAETAEELDEADGDAGGDAEAAGRTQNANASAERCSKHFCLVVGHLRATRD